MRRRLYALSLDIAPQLDFTSWKHLAAASPAPAQAASSVAVPPEAETCRDRARVSVWAPAAARLAGRTADRLFRLRRPTTSHRSLLTSYHPSYRATLGCSSLLVARVALGIVRAGLPRRVLVLPSVGLFSFSSASRGSCGFPIGVSPEVLGCCRNSATREIVPRGDARSSMASTSSATDVNAAIA